MRLQASTAIDAHCTGLLLRTKIRGNRSSKRVAESSEVTSMVPPCALAISRTTYKAESQVGTGPLRVRTAVVARTTNKRVEERRQQSGRNGLPGVLDGERHLIFARAVQRDAECPADRISAH